MSHQTVTSMIQIPGPACSIRAFEARPAGSAPAPAVIVIQEWWGLNDHIKDVATRFAREGYVAVAPDLYSRLGNKVTTDPDEAGPLMMSLEKPDGVADLLGGGHPLEDRRRGPRRSHRRDRLLHGRELHDVTRLQ